MTSEQVFAILKKLINSGGITPEQIKEAVDDYINQNGLPITPASESKINQLINTQIDSISVINCIAEEEQQ